jgi:LysM repeat protein
MIRLKSLLNEGNGPLKGQWLDKGLSIAKQLESRGFTKEQAAAIVGNMWAESTFNPSAENSIGAIGLLQWLGDRKKALLKFAKQKSRPWSDFNLQLDFIKYELLDAYNGEYSYEANQFSKAMRHGKTVQDRAEGFAKFSERPGAGELTDSLPTRRIAAHNVFTALTKSTKKSTSDLKDAIGKTVYALKKNGYVNVREEAVVDAGIFDNLLTTIKYPNPVGVVKSVVTGEDAKTWYQIKLSTGEIGYVRNDVVTTENEAYYVVQPGDTLTQIANKYKTTISAIQKKNPGLDPDKIRDGQKIKI